MNDSSLPFSGVFHKFFTALNKHNSKVALDLAQERYQTKKGSEKTPNGR
jgi:hypothetical protein